MANGHLCGDGFIGHPKIGQVRLHRRVQIQFALFDQLHHQQRCERFCDGANLKQCVFSDRQRMFDIGHAKWQNVRLAILPHADNRTRYLMGVHRFRYKCVQSSKECVHKIKFEKSA